MTQEDYNNYSAWRAGIVLNMPFLAGGYTQADWDILNGVLIDDEYMYECIDFECEKVKYINRMTKPYWA